MESIHAFVGHSFRQEDAGVVDRITKYLTVITSLHPKFTWEHAEPPEPTSIDTKVIRLFGDCNTFIGICTKKELVVQSSKVTEALFRSDKYTALKVDFEWKTSDWVIQEIGLAVGRGMKLIILLEDGVRLPGGLQGTTEYIPFTRDDLESCLIKLLGMIASLIQSPQQPPEVNVSAEPEGQDGLTIVAEVNANLEEPKKDDFLTPQTHWAASDYRMAYMHFLAIDNNTQAFAISEAYLQTPDGQVQESITSWKAFKISASLQFGKGGDIRELEELHNANPDVIQISHALGECYKYYEEFQKAAVIFEAATEFAKTPIKQIEFYSKAALSYQKTGDEVGADRCLSKMVDISKASGKGVEDVLRATSSIAESRSQNEIEIAALEKILELNPSDDTTRFSLAFKYGSLGRDNLAVFHYLRLGNIGSSAMNNLGASYAKLGLNIKAVEFYRQSIEQNETLAMNNLAGKYLDAGFSKEAREITEKAIQIKDHHLNVDKMMGKINENIASEKTKNDDFLKVARKISDFYRLVGNNLTESLSKSVIGTWVAPECEVVIDIADSKLSAIGTYEVSGGLASLWDLGASGATKYTLQYSGTIQGGMVVGTVSRLKNGETPKRKSALSIDEAANPEVIMWIEPSVDNIHVLERIGNQSPKFYVLTRKIVEKPKLVKIN